MRHRRLLLVWHSRTGLARQLVDSAAEGAHSVAAEMGASLNVDRVRAADATVEDLLGSDGFVFCAPENLASVSGEMLEFFHRSYYHVFSCEGSGLDYQETSQLLGRPCA